MSWPESARGWRVAFLFALASWPAMAQAQSQTDGLVHGAALRFSSTSEKRAGSVVGVYGSYGREWRELFEVGAARTALDYRDGSSFSQSGLVAAYNRFGARASGRAGAHLLASNDPITAGGVALFAGANAYRVGAWSAGTDVTWSRYPNDGAGLDVWQFAPTVGWTVRDATATRFLSAMVRGYAIALSDDMGLGARHYGSGEASLALTAGAVTVSGFGWAGEQAFAVRQGGFLVFNVAEQHTGGYGGGARWVVTSKAALSAGAYVERFLDPATGRDASATALTASFGFTF